VAERGLGESPRLQIVLLGTAPFAVPTLRALAQSVRVEAAGTAALSYEIAAVITRPDRPAGRGRKPRASAVKLAAQEIGLPVLQPERVSEEPGYGLLRELSPDVLLVVAFGELLSEKALSLPRIAAVNLHASLLPKYRGAAPIERAILAGEQETGVTAQWMALTLDAGDIILQRSLSIGAEEDFGSLHDRLAQLAAEVALETVELLREGAAPRRPQQVDGISYAPPIRRHELVLDWQEEASSILRLIRTFAPHPGARTTRAGRLLKILSARQDTGDGPEGDREGTGTPGRIVEVTKEGFWVKAGKGRVLALRVQPEARAAMSAGDYVKGYRLAVGEQLGR